MKHVTPKSTGIYYDRPPHEQVETKADFCKWGKAATAPPPDPVAVFNGWLADALAVAAGAGIIKRVRRPNSNDICFLVSGQCWKFLDVTKRHLRAMQRNLQELRAEVGDFSRCYRKGKMQSACLSAARIGRLAGMIPVRMFEPDAASGEASRVKGQAANYRKREAARAEAAKIHAFVKDLIPAAGFTPTSYSTACHKAREYFAVSKRTVQRATRDLKPERPA
jgi:hypothetical protein